MAPWVGGALPKLRILCSYTWWDWQHGPAKPGEMGCHHLRDAYDVCTPSACHSVWAATVHPKADFLEVLTNLKNKHHNPNHKTAITGGIWNHILTPPPKNFWASWEGCVSLGGGAPGGGGPGSLNIHTSK